jgi:hypothetical protein
MSAPASSPTTRNCNFAAAAREDAARAAAAREVDAREAAARACREEVAYAAHVAARAAAAPPASVAPADPVCAIPKFTLKHAMAERKRMQDEKAAQERDKWAAIRAAEKAVWDNQYLRDVAKKADVLACESVARDVVVKLAALKESVDVLACESVARDVVVKLAALKESVEELGNSLVSQIATCIEEYRSSWNIMVSCDDEHAVRIERDVMEPLRILIIKVHEQARINGYRFTEIDGMFAEWKAEDEGRAK